MCVGGGGLSECISGRGVEDRGQMVPKTDPKLSIDPFGGRHTLYRMIRNYWGEGVNGPTHKIEAFSHGSGPVLASW